MLNLALAIHMLASKMISMAKREGAQVRARLVLREIREGNQKLATQLDSKLTEIVNAIISLDKTMTGLVIRVTLDRWTS